MSGQSGQVVRIKYKLKAKWIAELKDPAGFAACCAKADGNCTDRILGEFLSGTGQIFHMHVTATEGKAGAGRIAGVEFKDGVAWKQAIEMPEPVFFAFKLTGTGQQAGGVTANLKADWCDSPPRVGHGTYFCGMSEWINSERKARDLALFEARRQFLKYVQEQIADDATLRESVGGDIQNLQVDFGENTDRLTVVPDLEVPGVVEAGGRLSVGPFKAFPMKGDVDRFVLVAAPTRAGLGWLAEVSPSCRLLPVLAARAAVGDFPTGAIVHASGFQVSAAPACGAEMSADTRRAQRRMYAEALANFPVCK